MSARAREREAERTYTIVEAAAILSLSPTTIRAAIKATEHNLPAKNVGTGARPTYRIKASALDAWFDSLPDAS